MHVPKDWDARDLEDASIEIEKFVSTKGYRWLADYIGTRQRFAQQDLVPKKPGQKQHGDFIEASSRYGELEDLMAQLLAVSTYKERRNAEKEAASGQ